MRIVALMLLIAVVAGIPAGAEATRVKATTDSTQIEPDPRNRYPDPRQQYGDPRLQYSDPRQQYPDPRQPYRNPRPTTGIEHRPAPSVIVITQPVYVTAPQSCVVPGYWAYTWVPQSSVSNVWVPGYYNADALWIDGHYEPRAYIWGYYQPYWVPDRPC